MMDLVMDFCEVQIYGAFPQDGCADCSYWVLCCKDAGLDPETGCPFDA